MGKAQMRTARYLLLAIQKGNTVRNLGWDSACKASIETLLGKLFIGSWTTDSLGVVVDSWAE